MRKPSHIERTRRRNALTKLQVQNLLGWDDMQYADFQYRMGIRYLEENYPDVPLAGRIPEHKEFWSWWKMHWNRRDREFLETTSLLFPDEYTTWYEEIHNPASIAFRPHAAILERSYTAMIHNLVKNAVR